MVDGGQLAGSATGARALETDLVNGAHPFLHPELRGTAWQPGWYLADSIDDLENPEFRTSVRPLTSANAVGNCEILVIDDDVSILATVREILQEESYVVCTARNGADALRMLEEARPWVILLDMRMPILDGWTFAGELGRRGLRVPVVVMTAARDARAWANEINADGYLAKPFEINELLDMVERFRP